MRIDGAVIPITPRNKRGYKGDQQWIWVPGLGVVLPDVWAKWDLGAETSWLLSWGWGRNPREEAKTGDALSNLKFSMNPQEQNIFSPRALLVRATGTVSWEPQNDPERVGWSTVLCCAGREQGTPGKVPPPMIIWARPLENKHLVIAMMREEIGEVV